jgi:IclR family transcriptional regulator, KDG regulon repressor
MKTMKTIAKVFNVLELFLTLKKDELSFREIAEASGLNKVTAHRIISTLINLGYLKQRRKRGKYSLGVRFLDFNGIMQNAGNFRNNTIFYLLELSRLVNESVYLTVWYGSKVLLTRAFDYQDGQGKIIPDEWSLTPLYYTCVGKIILANMSEEDQNKYLNSKPMEKKTPKTIVDKDKIKEYLAKIKREGISVEDEESQMGVRAIGAGIRNSEGEIVGAVHIIGTTTNLTYSTLEKITLSVKRCAMEISKELGYRV